jgi:hypothetical protein
LDSPVHDRNHFICGDKGLHSETQRRRGLFAETRIQDVIASFVVKGDSRRQAANTECFERSPSCSFLTAE